MLTLMWNGFSMKWETKVFRGNIIFFIIKEIRFENVPSTTIGHKKWDSDLQNKGDRDRDNKGWPTSV